MEPVFTNLSNWAASLIIDFPDDIIPILYNEDNWKEWGNQLVIADTFLQNNVPGTGTFNTWEAWATEVFLTLADK